MLWKPRGLLYVIIQRGTELAAAQDRHEKALTQRQEGINLEGFRTIQPVRVVLKAQDVPAPRRIPKQSAEMVLP